MSDLTAVIIALAVLEFLTVVLWFCDRIIARRSYEASRLVDRQFVILFWNEFKEACHQVYASSVSPPTEVRPDDSFDH